MAGEVGRVVFSIIAMFSPGLLCKVLADLHSAAELKEAAVKFVVEHSEEFVDQVTIYVVVQFRRFLFLFEH